MARFLHSGTAYNFRNSGGTAIVAGDVVVNGNLFGVAQEPIPVGGIGTILLDGVFEMPKASGAITLGAALYWDATNSNVTTTASTNLLCGFAVEAAESAATVAKVKINHWQEKAAEVGGGGT